MNISKTLLKNGIKEILSENDNYFKTNIEQALAVKLNDSISSVREEVCSRLFEDTETIQSSSNLSEFINFIQSFKAGNFIFEDGSVINITENEKELVKNLFENLNTKNKNLMVNQLFTNSTTFKQHIEFAQQTRKLQ